MTPRARVTIAVASALVVAGCSSDDQPRTQAVPPPTRSVASTPAPVTPAGKRLPACGAGGVRSGTTCTYRTVGSDAFVVPAGVTQVDVTVVGAMGGRYFVAGDAAHGGSPQGDITGRPGGAGGQVTATLRVSAGDVLQVDVAGRGARGSARRRSGGMRNGPSGGTGARGGFGGSSGGVEHGRGDGAGADGGTAHDGGNGSGGGGSSDVRAAPGGCAALTCPLGARLLVAGGGGGGGGVGGQGGALGGAGGNAGGASGANGGSLVDGGNHGVSGRGATPGAGGAAGLNAARHAPRARPRDPRYGGDGAKGGSGTGGEGGAGNLPCTDPSFGDQCEATVRTSGGGAGGGGIGRAHV